MSLQLNGVEPVPAIEVVTVLVVDDQQAVREGLSRLISCAAMPLRCVATVATGADALLAASLHQPTVVVLDVDLGGEDGLALIPQFAPATRVLVLTCHGDTLTRARASTMGASAFIEKHEPAAVLLRSIVNVGRAVAIEETSPIQQGTRSHLHLTASSDVPVRLQT